MSAMIGARARVLQYEKWTSGEVPRGNDVTRRYLHITDDGRTMGYPAWAGHTFTEVAGGPG